MLRRLLPRERQYFELFQQQTSVIRQGLDLFDSLLQDGTTRDRTTLRIREVEREADEVAHRIFQQLNRTFITPFDREDIRLLAERLDDVMDLVEATAARLTIYEISELPDEVVKMAHVLQKAFDRISEAVAMLENTKHREEVFELCVEVNRLENEGDVLLRLALVSLFKEGADPLHVIKMKEVIENLEEAIDRCEDLANVLETILLKNS